MRLSDYGVRGEPLIKRKYNLRGPGYQVQVKRAS
jgi:hypothetical protein